MKLPRVDFTAKGLELTDEAFHGLHVTLDTTRRTSLTARVDRDALRLLLSDHGKALAHIDALERNLRHATPT